MSSAILVRFVFLILVPLFTLSDSASAMVFQAPEASSKEFAQHLTSRGQLSYTQWVFKNDVEFQNDVLPNVSAFVEKSLSRSFTDESEMLLAWENLRTTENLRLVDRELLLLLAEKIGNSAELCRLVLLDPTLEKKLAQSERKMNCLASSKAVPMDFLEALDRSDIISIDGKLFTYDSVPQRLMPGKYRWKVFSNRFVDREFVESLDKARSALKRGNPWVDGDCQNAKVTHPDFAVQTQASIYFHDHCTPAGLPVAAETKSWYSSKNSWAWGIGILLVGATAYTLRDKELVITSH